jgi:hypothetical protein
MGISCKGIVNVLSDYLHGEAGKGVCSMIEDHLRGCKRCRMHIDNMKLIIKLYKKWRDDSIPDDVSIRLRNVIAAEAQKQAARREQGTSPKGRSRKPPKTGAGKRTSEPMSRRSTSERVGAEPVKRRVRAAARKAAKPVGKRTGKKTTKKTGSPAGRSTGKAGNPTKRKT